jgi:CMP-N-acetylneuraminic acid synthetase
LDNTKSIVAVVPVREGSTRVINKNFRKFFKGASLLENKIEQLKKSNIFDKIYISSDSHYAKITAKEQGVEFLLRDSKYCVDGHRNDEIVDHIVSTVPGNPYIAYVLVTNPFFNRYKEAINTFFDNENSNDSLVAVHNSKDFYLNQFGRPINYTFGPWHEFSQDLEPMYKITGGLFFSLKSTMQYLHYYIGISPFLFETSLLESIDIDCEEQFSLAQLIAENQRK